MKKNVTLAIMVMAIVNLTAQAQKKEFGWLIGTWKLKDKNIIETWSVDKDGKSLNGVSMKMNGSEAVVLEEIKIIFSGNSFYYIPDVAGDQDPVDFHFSSFDESSFVAENPSHDFPKLIRYKLIEDGDQQFIEAAIEGDGKIIPYHFEKVR